MTHKQGWSISNNFFGGNRVDEACRVERVQNSISGLRIGIHQEANRSLLLSRKHEIARIVEPNPVHFPTTEQSLAQRAHLITVNRDFLLQHDLTYIGRIDWQPAGTVARLGVMPRWLLADADRWLRGSVARSRCRACRCRRRSGLGAAGRRGAGSNASAVIWPFGG